MGREHEPWWSYLATVAIALGAFALVVGTHFAWLAVADILVGVAVWCYALVWYRS